ncbi:MAG: Eco57I restriction-modification methylase domain-containing protein, partial [Coriobacteriia bacterium]|nr:Eco57I restriction-modification methylase domain-containing protein [Coriobacteriia bacterium]
MSVLPLFSDDYVLSLWESEFAEWRASGEDEALRVRLARWADRDLTRTETQLEQQFVSTFFSKTWGYWGTGENDRERGFCLDAKYGVSGAGQMGGKGAADLALGWWGLEGVAPVAQVLCEFKDIRSSLDAPQKRKGNDRTPVEQCFDYLKYEFDHTDVHSTLKPSWGLVTDMNEFRLYARSAGDERYQQFIVKATDGRVSLVDETDEGAFQRFLLARLFQRDMLLALSGQSPLHKLLDRQWVLEKDLERDFYREYQSYRESVFQRVKEANPDVKGTRGKLVKLTQRFLDRCIFILFCEDMGQALEFPTDLLRGMLADRSNDPYYDPNADDTWGLLKRLFRSMRDGGAFPPSHSINRFNGGLFEEYPELEDLVIPNRVFCAKGQGQNAETLAATKDTLLYLSAHYNFGAHGVAHQRTITLYALGRIFEQSITDLEYMEAEAEERESVAALSKRKRDGVYYTPEKVTAYIVKETIGAQLDDIRKGLDFTFGAELPEADLGAYRKFLSSRRAKAPQNAASKHLRALDGYEEELLGLRVLDPACGSGAFLIQALQFLLGERRAIAEERARVVGGASLFDTDASIREILANNLYGVDINPESVEITQLALWLNTASPGKPLSNLDTHIRCGNSLVGPDYTGFYQSKHPATLFAELDEQAQEDVNVFDWEAAFPDVLGPDVPEDQRGFDCVIGNPPYVKLQHFRKVKPDESDYYVDVKRADGRPLYESAQTGNFDFYLLFIEKGLSLLNKAGRMGFIAPSLWLKNQYGLGLRRKVKHLRGLDRWIDFGSYQVFSEATTYTALQFFRATPVERVRFFLAPDGDITSIDWAGDVEAIGYDQLPDEDAWNLAASDAAALLARLAGTCTQLGDAGNTRQIFQGLITSADVIYHLQRVAGGRYRQVGSRADGQVHEIEDAIMHPLVSGPEAKRYLQPETDTYLLFPYAMEADRPRLFSEDEMRTRFPKARAYLKKYEAELRDRERGAFDDEAWYRFGRHQNIDKQELPKLGVAQTVPGMRVFADPKGEFYFNNVRVNGIIPAEEGDLFFLLGVLNSRVTDFVFQRTAKPKGGGY